MNGRVYLVGAGPGDPELLTLKALRVLEAAELLLHDDLVPPGVLALASPAAMVLNVGKRCGRKGTSQEEINQLMISRARSGYTVARLHGGDPLIFGRAGEEMSALREAGVDFEVVPGVTSALAAAASAGLTLTERRISSCVVFTTGHHCARAGQAKSSGLFPEGLAADSTVVVYMPTNLALIAAELRACGWDAETPCLLVSNGSLPSEEISLTKLGNLPDVTPLASPRLLIIGAVAKPLIPEGSTVAGEEARALSVPVVQLGIHP
jgi:uroporphyrin-III C-methyltransferase